MNAVAFHCAPCGKPSADVTKGTITDVQGVRDPMHCVTAYLVKCHGKTEWVEVSDQQLVAVRHLPIHITVFKGVPA